jgi:hypothetical protein
MRRLRGVSGTGEVKMEGVCARVDEVERWGGCGILKIGYGDALLLDIALTWSKMPLLP